MSNSSAASRREAPLSTLAITRMRISAEYAFGMGGPPTNQFQADSPIYSRLGILRFYSARTCSSIVSGRFTHSHHRGSVGKRCVLWQLLSDGFRADGRGRGQAIVDEHANLKITRTLPPQ